ncbi:MAG: peptidase caspase catalytic subunit p20, partial [Verrucomicrobiales bacterium]|nr:peptidase caspase catalytic subunit p20 [Verrucomicrobiales bacterium]
MSASNRHFLSRKLVYLLVVTASAHCGGMLLAATEGAKGITIEPSVAPMSAAQVSAEKMDSTTAAGIFLGVNKFDTETLATLTYAVDDAIDLAFLFAEDLKLIYPSNIFLALGGTPTKEASEKRLKILLEHGATRTAATHTEFYKLLHKAPRLTRGPGLLVIHISSHGFDENGKAYVMLQDSDLTMLADTGVPLTSIEHAMGTGERSGRAARGLLLIDACRSKATQPPKSAKGGNTLPYAAPEAFATPFLAAKGQATLSAADKDHYSYEDAEFQQGVFTHFIIEGLKGNVPGDASGLIRLGDLASWVSDQVQNHTRSKEQPQVIRFSWGENARYIPLAYDATKDMKDLQQRKDKAVGLLLNAMHNQSNRRLLS